MQATKIVRIPATVQKLAQKRFGKGAGVVIDTRALTPEKRAERAVEIREWASRIKAIDDELDSLPKDHCDSLLKAAEFVCDVNGDHPSIDQLRAAAATTRRVSDLLAERKECRDRQQKLQAGMHRHKFEVMKTSQVGSVAFTSIPLSADTLDELKEKLGAK